MRREEAELLRDDGTELVSNSGAEEEEEEEEEEEQEATTRRRRRRRRARPARARRRRARLPPTSARSARPTRWRCSRLYTRGCNRTFHCKCVLKYLAQLSVQQEHTYIDGATPKLAPLPRPRRRRLRARS